MPWKNVKVRADLHEMVARRARQETRSVAQMTDRLLMRALEQETNTPASSGGGPPEGVIPGESQRGADVGRGAVYRRDASDAKPAEAAPSPARAPVAQRIEGQTTVDEMLVSCPNCAGELTDNGTVAYCSECAYVRERT